MRAGLRLLPGRNATGYKPQQSFWFAAWRRFSSILDTATFWALYCCIGENDGITTLNLQVNNLAAINSGTIIAEGRLIRMGRTIGLAEGTLKDENGRLLAQGTSKNVCIAGLAVHRQSCR
ncbi:MAG: PaaI family thioesterase [Acidaminococcaceae bacterium]|nr:PaaI family thioesterase [Acidaminococcaceae bacterium]